MRRRKRKHEILLVDDEKSNLDTLVRLFRRKYRVFSAQSGEEALEILKEQEVVLILTDQRMPGITGAKLLESATHMYPDAIRIILSGFTDTSDLIEAINSGRVYRYIIKPWNNDELQQTVDLAIESYELMIENRRLVAELQQAYLETIFHLSRAAEYKDKDTGAHIVRMSNYAAAIARQMGLSDNEVKLILYASSMHDVGKIGVSDHILLKPDKLIADEWEVMKKHPDIGGSILENSDSDFIQLAQNIALTHHEKWDGSGYPFGLKEEEIPLTGRIVALADVFDALTSKRPYKDSFSLEKAFAIIKEGQGRHFDPKVVDAFFAIEDEILSIREKYQE